jgi:hypothetical protein
MGSNFFVRFVMRLLHYSSDPIASVHSVEQREDVRRYDKPQGLWVSVEGEDDWRSWCEGEQFGSPAEQICYRVELSAPARILRLSGSLDLLHFTEEYGFNPYADDRLFSKRDGIRWWEIAKQYDGIIIAPYCWQQRLELMWYYSWDCASGCIWNADAVECLVEEADATAIRAPQQHAELERTTQPIA